MKNKLYFSVFKKLGIFLLASAMSISTSFATIHMVGVSNLVFTPANINVNVGDTMQWNWVNGSHTTTADASGIPAGAATWNSQMNSTVTTFSYRITVAGVYNYYCVPHQGSGMVATFTASPSTATPKPAVKENTITVYPNPFVRFLTIDMRNITSTGKNVAISIYDMLGNQYYTNEFVVSNADSKITLDLDKVRAGIYFINIMTNDKKVIYRLVKDAPTSKIEPVVGPFMPISASQADITT